MTIPAAMNGPLSAVDAVAAERAIRRCLLDYCRGVDRLDEAMIASVFHADGTADYGTFNGLGASFARGVTRMLHSHAVATTHFLGDSFIEFTSPTTAETETQVLAWHRVRDNDGEFLEKFAGRYHDRFECRGGDWRVAHRRLTHDWDAIERVTNAFAPDTFHPSPRA